ncbi:hypothetical protein TWF718_007672 [Orbilia javanica]|uniref:Retrovirus-related Pol polyprotein from transposon TNT 1-94-like beta-barrel domain-containing protein n=1 Tax=Orbilia javanica TaxID=47235 RepID=A0AAN8MTV1_9PEZI
MEPSSSSSQGHADPGSDASEPPYRTGEKAWLKKHYGGEFHFLLSYGLKIHDEKDREEGRRILRALRQHQQDQREKEQRNKAPRTIQEESAERPKRGSQPTSSDSSTHAAPRKENENLGDRSFNPQSLDLESHILPAGDNFNVDWVFSNTSNVHVANHRGWFKTYTPFSATTVENITAVGAGSVELPVATNKGFAILTLRNVLHTPNSICNVLCLSGLTQYGLETSFGRGETSRIYLDASRTTWAIMDSSVLVKLRLAGQSPEQTSLDPEAMYMIRATLSKDDLARMIRATTVHDKTRALQKLVYEFENMVEMI